MVYGIYLVDKSEIAQTLYPPVDDVPQLLRGVCALYVCERSNDFSHPPGSKWTLRGGITSGGIYIFQVLQPSKRARVFSTVANLLAGRENFHFHLIPQATAVTLL